ncbi:MAG TPA: hypothetical protein DCM71_25165 [Runella sp.]|nr:hypothetical protein [Runella sp.]
MVKVGFIVEGETEKLIIDSENFQSLLTDLKIDCISEAIDAKGNGNLLPHNIIPFQAFLKEKGADYIFILTDRDDDACITLTRQRISERDNQYIIVAVQKIEAWFLADSQTLSVMVGKTTAVDYPESETVPFEKIGNIIQHQTGRGIGTRKVRFALNYLRKGFSLRNAAAHPNCPSARYFLNKLQSLNY